MTRSRRTRSRRGGVRVPLLAPPVFLVLAGGLAALSTGDSGTAQDALGVDGVRAALEQMVETRRIISQERTEWELGRRMLTTRKEVVQGEIDDLREKIATARQSIDDSDARYDELTAENEQLKAASAGLAEMAGALEARTLQLLSRVPAPLQARVRPLSQRFPQDPAATDLSLSSRFQNVIGVLNEINKFNREVTVESEVRTVDEGLTPQQIEVATIYVGLAYGFYSSSDGRHAGTGTATATADAWTWTERNLAAANIQQAIAILQSEGIADFVQLPITID